MRTFEHYGEVKGNIQAGAITYFGFISFFPILALAFAVVGFVARVYPTPQDDLVDAINSVLPGLVGEGRGSSLSATSATPPPLRHLRSASVVLYSGLGWLSSMRDALIVMFELPEREQPNFFIGKVRDLIALVPIGLVLLVSVGVSGVVRGLSERSSTGSASAPTWAGCSAARRRVRAGRQRLCCSSPSSRSLPTRPASRALWSGAFLGAVGFEVLKQISQLPAAVDPTRPLPGLRHRADPRGLDLLLLPGRHVRRVVGADASAAAAQRVAEPEAPSRVRRSVDRRAARGRTRTVGRGRVRSPRCRCGSRRGRRDRGQVVARATDLRPPAQPLHAPGASRPFGAIALRRTGRARTDAPALGWPLLAVAGLPDPTYARDRRRARRGDRVPGRAGDDRPGRRDRATGYRRWPRPWCWSAATYAIAAVPGALGWNGDPPCPAAGAA